MSKAWQEYVDDTDILEIEFEEIPEQTSFGSAAWVDDLEETYHVHGLLGNDDEATTRATDVTRLGVRVDGRAGRLLCPPGYLGDLASLTLWRWHSTWSGNAWARRSRGAGCGRSSLTGVR